MSLKRDIKKAIEDNTNYKVKKVLKPDTSTYGYNHIQNTIIMSIEIVVKKR